MPQDMPPSGGYEPVQFKRNLPSRGFRGSYLVLGMAVFTVFGLYKAGQGIRERNELVREKLWSRYFIMPVLQAEEDRDLVRKVLADKARERELFGRETSVYNGERTVRPTFIAVPPMPWKT